MTTKRTTKSKRAPSARAFRQWQESPLYDVCSKASYEAKLILSAARKNGIDIADGSFIAQHLDAALHAMKSTENAWLAGDDKQAAKFAALAGVMVGIMARDNDAVFNAYRKKQKHSARQPRRPEGITAAMRRTARVKGTALERWPHLYSELRNDFELEEDGDAYVIEYANGKDEDRSYHLSFKTFQNYLASLKSRQPG
ncbi:MAG: hypothetical protein QM741_13430 [Rudaea sp.]|uniref:hypothetical protein n=1 Tax=Rudaea sp. TaxID=2136325 RepID=UPI0039E6A7F0